MVLNVTLVTGSDAALNLNRFMKIVHLNRWYQSSSLEMEKRYGNNGIPLYGRVYIAKYTNPANGILDFC